MLTVRPAKAIPRVGLKSYLDLCNFESVAKSSLQKAINNYIKTKSTTSETQE
jgi:hypothetical protein